MITANSKMRRLMLHHFFVFIFFIPRVAYMCLLAYASSEVETNCGEECDPCQPLPVILYSWILSTQEMPAMISAFSSAIHTTLSIWFILTADEKEILRSGRFISADLSLENQVELKLHKQIGLNNLL
jgi:hypothetical protein